MDQDTLVTPSAPALFYPRGHFSIPAMAGAAGQGVRQYLVNAPRPIDRGGQSQQGPALQQDAAHTPLAAGDQHLSVGQTGLENHLGILKGKKSDI